MQPGCPEECFSFIAYRSSTRCAPGSTDSLLARQNGRRSIFSGAFGIGLSNSFFFRLCDLVTAWQFLKWPDDVFVVAQVWAQTGLPTSGHLVACLNLEVRASIYFARGAPSVAIPECRSKSIAFPAVD